MRTIYKKVYEKLRGEQEVVSDVDNIFGDVHIHRTNSMVELTEEEFKKALGSKKPVNLLVYRETFVIELDEENGKIVAKKYLVQKNSGHIKKINKTILKSNKTYTSLTFDLNTREFSVYKASTNAKNRKTKPFIRRDAITYQVLNTVSDLFDCSYITNEELSEGLNIIAKYLGYQITVAELCEIYDYKTSLGEAFNNNRNQTITQQAKFFVLLNHLSRTGIVINPLNMLEIGVNFRNNKKEYFGKTIAHYYADELEIDDMNFIQSIINKKDLYNTAVLSRKMNEHKAPEPTLSGAFDSISTKSEAFMKLNFTAIKFLYHLGYTSERIITTHLADLVFEKTSDTYYSFNDLKETKKASVSDITKNIEILRNLAEHNAFRVERVLSLFYLQKKLEVIYGLKVDLELLIRNMEINNHIEDILKVATNETGVYSVSDRFLNGLKKHLPEGAKISVGKKVGIDPMSSVAYVNVRHKKNMFTIYVDENGIRWWDTQNKPTRIHIFDTPVIKKEKQSELGKALRAYELSFNRGTKPISIRANYAKKHFEHLLGDVVTRNMYENIINGLVYLDK
jgi:hypothetical protein